MYRKHMRVKPCMRTMNATRTLTHGKLLRVCAGRLGQSPIVSCYEEAFQLYHNLMARVNTSAYLEVYTMLERSR